MDFQLSSNFYLSSRDNTPFLFRQERCPKEADLKGAELLAPASKAMNYGAIATGNRPILIRCAEHHPLRISRPALSKTLEQLNLKPVPGKNVPIFTGQFSAAHIGRAGRAAAPAIVCPDNL